MGLTRNDIPADVRALIRRGTVVPAHPLALDAGRRLDPRRQRALTRYYLDAGAGGLAVGVHATQFAIREAGLYETVLELAAATAEEWTNRPVAMIAGLAGRTGQAVAEAKTAVRLGYHAGLLSLGAMKDASEDELVAHCRRLADEIPLVGFYLQPAVGGRPLSAAFWRRFAGIDNAIAVKAAPFDRYRTSMSYAASSRRERRIGSPSTPATTTTSCWTLRCPWRSGGAARKSASASGEGCSATGASGRGARSSCWRGFTRR